VSFFVVFVRFLSQIEIFISDIVPGNYNIDMRLKTIRVEKKYSQREISEVLCVRQNTYSQYETGVRQIPIECLIRLSRFYHVCVDYLLGLTEEEDPYP